jgi:hypothetical protein
MDEYYLTIKSKDRTYGRKSDFVLTLPKTLNLEGQWACCLEEIYSTGTERLPNYHVCCSICEEGLTPRLPALRYINGKIQKEFATCRLFCGIILFLFSFQRRISISWIYNSYFISSRLKFYVEN